jgi:cell shape-determining protein MreC
MPNRLLCDVLQEMRKSYETRNFSYLSGLIEEAQSLGNRMEAGLGDKKSCKYYADRLSETRKQVKEVEELTKELPGLRAEKKALESAVKKARHEYDKATRGDTIKCGVCNREYVFCECNG